MERHELQNKVAVAIASCRTATNVAISDHFTAQEIYDFANTIVAYLPADFNSKVEDLNEDVFDMIAGKKDFLFYLYGDYIRKIYAKLLKRDRDVKVELIHIVIISLLLLKEEFDENTDEVINSGINYYKSLVINSNDLAKNVHEIPARGAVAEFDNKGNYIRVDYDIIRFVPTLTTKHNFNYLMPTEWRT